MMDDDAAVNSLETIGGLVVSYFFLPIIFAKIPKLIF
jgi:hypothetical protein